MITESMDIKLHDELIIDRDGLCTQLEAGNPFLTNQDVVFSVSKLMKSEQEDPCRLVSSAESERTTSDFFQKSLDFSLQRTYRLPNSPDIVNSLGLDYLRMGDIEEAVKAFERALTIDKDYFPAMANLAKCHSIKGDLDNAIAIYDELEGIRANDARVLSNIALLHFKKHELDKALDYYRKAHQVAPKNHSVLNNLGLAYLAKGNVNEAISTLRRAMRQREDDATIHNNLGVCFIVQNEAHKALHQFKIAYHLNKNGRDILQNITNAYQKIGKHERAISVLDDFLESHPEEVELRNALAWSYFQLGLYKKCIRALRTALNKAKEEDKANRASFLNNLAVVFEHMGEKERARELFLESIRQNPDSDQIIHFNLIDFYFKHNELDNAKEHIETALSLYKDHPVLMSYLGDYHSLVEEYETAKEIYSRVLELDYNIIVPYLQISSIELEVYRNIDHALDILMKGFTKFPNNEHLINNYAYGLILNGQLREARTVLDKISAEDNPHLTATRGLLLIREGNIEEGRRQYNLAVSLAGSNENLAALVKQKKHLELGKYYIGEGNKKRALHNLKKGLKVKTRQTYFKEEIIELLAELDDL